MAATMYSLALSAVALLATILPATLAQTHTDCNPLNSTGCPTMPALGGNATFDFNKTSGGMNPNIWIQKNQGSVDYSDKGTTFTVTKRGDAPYVQSSFYLFFGRMEVIMKAASGTGIVSSAILQSEDLDEIDWEFLGGNKTHVLTNYYGKGNNTYDPARGADFPMSGAPQDDFHNYTTDWTKERIQWWVDGKMLRELKYADALNGQNFPQTPMSIRLGCWAGGDTKNNPPETVKWAGGETNFDAGPFTMTVQTVYAQDYTSAKEYSWENMDKTGSWEKVKVVEGKSAVLEEANKPHGIKNRWNALSKTAQIAVIASIVGFVAICACIIAFCCVKQRRAGRREFAALQAQQDKEAAELLQHKQNFAAGRHGGYGRV